MAKYLFYTGSFNDAFSICEFDTDQQKLSHIRKIPHPRPAYLTLSSDQKNLYVASEMCGEPGGVAAFAISDPYNPVLRTHVMPPNSQGPCYILLSDDGKYLLGCSYFEGNVEVFPIYVDGSIGERCCEYRFTTTGTASLPGLTDQFVPHSHGAISIRGSNMVLVTDYSGDRVVCFALDHDGNITEKNSLLFQKGDAPRHLALHPSRDDIVYMVTEFTSMVYSIKVDMKTGALTQLNSIHTLQDEKASLSSAIKVSPNGSFVYVPNRHNKNISVLSLNDSREGFSHVGVLPSVGFVRDLVFDPTGNYIVMGDQHANQIMLYKMNHENGMGAELNSIIETETPACFVFLTQLQQ